MSKYAINNNEDSDKTEETGDPLALPDEAEFWSYQQKRDYLNNIASELYKKEQEAAKAKAKAEALEAKRIANLVKPDKVEAFEKVYRIQGKKIHRNAVYWCEFSPNSERLATCGHDMCIGVWDVAGNSNPERSVAENQGQRVNQGRAEQGAIRDAGGSLQAGWLRAAVQRHATRDHARARCAAARLRRRWGRLR